MKDEKNPDYIFQGTDTSLLLQIVKDEVDSVELAKKELANRGFGTSGQWIGFQKAKKLWNSVFYRNGKMVTIPED